MVELPLSMHVHWKQIIRIRFTKKEQSFDRFVVFDIFRHYEISLSNRDRSWNIRWKRDALI